jgi:DNA-binding FadR family transcriptional regulator
MVETEIAYIPPVLEQLEDWIGKSGMSIGARLPPERHLCDELGVTRAELRKALAVLEIKGLVERKVGVGTFLTDAPDLHAPEAEPYSLKALAEQTSPHDAMETRLTLEPELASLAAIHATPRQLADLRQLSEAMRGSTDWATYERLDAEFHALIASAAGNTLLSELFKIVNAVRLAVVWKRLAVPPDGPPVGYHSFGEHEAILDALDHRDRARAHAAMRAHIKSTVADMHADDR